LAELLAKRSRNEKGTGFEPVPFSFSVLSVASGVPKQAALWVLGPETTNAPDFRARWIVLGVRGVPVSSPAGDAVAPDASGPHRDE